MNNEKTVRQQYEFTSSKLRLNRRLGGKTKWFMPTSYIPKTWCKTNGVEFNIYIAVLKQMRAENS